jgi:hypothetical protein
MEKRGSSGNVTERAGGKKTLKKTNSKDVFNRTLDEKVNDVYAISFTYVTEPQKSRKHAVSTIRKKALFHIEEAVQEMRRFDFRKRKGGRVTA